MSQAGLINTIGGIENMRYLELGIYDGHHADSITAKEKTTVDIRVVNPASPPTHLMTTDQFFAQTTGEWDVVYIDADHDCTSIFRDFNNSVMRLAPNGVICLHDLHPDCAADTAPHISGTGYKFLHALRRVRYPHVYTLKGDYGWTFIWNPAQQLGAMDLKMNVSYDAFRACWGDQYHLYSVPEMAEVIKELTNG